MHLTRNTSAAVCLALAVACGGTEPSNTPPVAAFTARCSQLACTFENASTDEDGTITGYAWTFGDGGASTDPSPSHSYGAPGGEFTVTMAVTDNDGAAVSVSRRVTVSQGSETARDLAPIAAFSVSCAGLVCSFTDASTDPDSGDAVVSRAWNFGDMHSSADTNPVHTYDQPGGLFDVSLTVTDRRGVTGIAHRSVQVFAEPAPNTPNIIGTFVRETPHSSTKGDSRYVIRADGTFDYVEERPAGPTTLSGRWRFATSWGGWPLAPGNVVLFDFDNFAPDGCGQEAIGSFLLGGYLGISLCGVMINAGLEEGVYTDVAQPGAPDIPPPQGGQIAFVRDGKIFRVNTDGTGLLQLSAGPDGDPAWSPDGQRIAFSRGGEAGGIYVMNADGSNPVRRAISGESPTWSPDGRTIAFACRVNLDGGICAVGADETATGLDTLLARQGQVTAPAWSPDGTRIAFGSDWNMFDFWFDLWVMSPDGSEIRVLREHSPSTPNTDEQYQPAWSPQGQRLALVECPWAFKFCSSSVVAVMNADGSGLVRLAAASGAAHPTWSPDGQLIAFANANAIEWTSADGSQRGRIIADGAAPAWRP